MQVMLPRVYSRHHLKEREAYSVKSGERKKKKKKQRPLVDSIRKEAAKPNCPVRGYALS
jgi:hypothetical protein